MIVKNNNNDSYLSPVPPSNGTGAPNNYTVALNNGTIAKKMGAVVGQIFAGAAPLFSMTNHPLHPFLAPKSTVLHY